MIVAHHYLVLGICLLGLAGCTAQTGKTVDTTPAQSQAKAQKAYHPEARPYDAKRNAKADLEEALVQARKTNKRVILVMGANWCHDSRGLAGWFQEPRFEEMLTPHFEIVYVDVAQKNRNIDIAQRFGLDAIVGTPTVFILTGEGEVLNFETAPTWRNAASRTEDEIFEYFYRFRPEIAVPSTQ